MQSIVAALLAVLAVAGLPVAAAAQQVMPPHIITSGEGTARVVPDLAVIQAGVTTQGKTARDASAANSAAMTRVQAALKSAGIADRDLQTAYFSIRPMSDSRRDGDTRITGFQATNEVSVRIRALGKLATVLDQMIAAGANDVSGIHFVVAEKSTLLDRARAEAVLDARRKAEQLAKAAGVRLGPPRSIIESDSQPPQGRMAMRAAPASVPVAIGEQTLQVHVSVTFELLH
jgi:uncharacterized protein YggE